MKVAITGAKGMLGTTLMNTLEGHELFALDREDCDVTKPSLVCSVFEKIKPDVVIHCAAMTSVDLCESKQFEAWKTNAFGTTNGLGEIVLKEILLSSFFMNSWS